VFVADYAKIAKPLSDLLRSDETVVFGEGQLRAFETLKTHLTKQPVLKIYNPNHETELHTDACSTSYAGILLQRDPEDRMFHPVYYYSKKLQESRKSRNHTNLKFWQL
jgi:hypothetical protein